MGLHFSAGTKPVDPGPPPRVSSSTGSRPGPGCRVGGAVPGGGMERLFFRPSFLLQDQKRQRFLMTRTDKSKRLHEFVLYQK